MEKSLSLPQAPTLFKNLNQRFEVFENGFVFRSEWGFIFFSVRKPFPQTQESAPRTAGPGLPGHCGGHNEEPLQYKYKR